jgi:hypothetical protein
MSHEIAKITGKPATARWPTVGGPRTLDLRQTIAERSARERLHALELKAGPMPGPEHFPPPPLKPGHMTQECATEEEEGAASRPVTFGLYPMDKDIQTRLLDACRALLKRATPEQVRDLAYLMHALHRLPSTTPGVRGGVTLATRDEDSAAYRGFELNADEFILTTGESMNFGCGTDHESRNVLEVGTSAMRDIENGDDFTEWLNLFCEQAEDSATEIEIFCVVDNNVGLSDNSKGVTWEDNPLLEEI